MQITIPDFSLVTLIGATGCGKSTFASKHFLETEIVSSDRCRGLVADDEEDQSATKPAFEVLYTIAEKRLAGRRLTVIDATNLRAEDRAKGIEIARKYHALPVALVFDIPPEVSIERNNKRENRRFGPRVVYEHAKLLHRSIKNLRREGYRVIHVLEGVDAVAEVRIVREPLYNDKRNDHGPFDLIGDIHGCNIELDELLTTLGYQDAEVQGRSTKQHPAGRRVIFLGDIVDRGPGVVEALRTVMDMVAAGTAICVPGNHEQKLLKKLQGRAVKETHGLAETLAQIDALESSEREAFLAELIPFLDGLVSHYWLDDGKLVAAHAGMREEMQGRGSGEVRNFALYGETTGETDEFGLPVRYNWAADYRGKATVVYGHTPVPEATWLNKTICIDTGCVYGGALTALRYPELELVGVKAQREYAPPVRPLRSNGDSDLTVQQASDGILRLEDVAGKKRIQTRYGRRVEIPEENATAALEVISRFCVDPRWLIYLPPTMSPSETSQAADVLEHPNEALAYFRKAGVPAVIFEEKHMGSRAVIVIARDEAAARERFGVDGGSGVIVTRTGRSFFTGEQAPLHDQALEKLRRAMDVADFWQKHNTTWACIDAEILPWSAKAQTLVDEQYAPVGEAALAALGAQKKLLETSVERGRGGAELLERVGLRLEAAVGFVDAFRRYVKPVEGIADIQVAPFHLLATEGAVHVDKDHLWHLQALSEICAADSEFLFLTRYRVVNFDRDDEVVAAVEWWRELTSSGGEGVVVKPLSFVARSERGFLQPALKVRGPEYLRIVYGPEYRLPDQLERLRERAIASKRRLALDEFSLGLEGLHRFVGREPLRAVHECVFGVLALESEAIDPRL